MITEIGITAGEIWAILDKKEELSVDELVTLTGRSRELVLMSIGWLVREGHVVMESSTNSYRIRLRNSAHNLCQS